MLRYSRDSRRHALLAVLSAGIACLVAPGIAGAAQAAESAGAVRDYWTPERMKTAIPGDALLQDVAPVAPLGDVSLGLADAERRGERATKVANPKSKPFRKHGKVFFTLGSLDYVCSGTSVKSKTRSLVVTAGHCTYSEMDGYASNFMFAPAYDGGNTPFGEWSMKKIKATPQWEDREDIRYDVGMATMSKLNGKKLGRVVGSRGIAFDQKRNQSFDAIGYPAEERFDGETMYHCVTRGEGSDPEQNNPRPTRIDCDMTGGSSGGGWVIDGGKVNSVVSYGYECALLLPICENPEEGKLFGPYFGGEIKQLYRSQKR